MNSYLLSNKIIILVMEKGIYITNKNMYKRL